MRLMQVILHGVNLEADLLNPKVSDRYEKGFNTAVAEINAAKECTTGAEGIRRQCNAVIDYVDDVFGHGTAKKVFGEETDLITCLDVLEEMMDLYDKQVAPVVQERSRVIGEKIKGHLMSNAEMMHSDM